MAGPGFITGKPWFKNGLPVFGTGRGCGDVCTALFSYESTIEGDSCTFDFTDESTPEGEIVSWHWDFGDGDESFAQNPTHTYSHGNFTVVLTVVLQNDESCQYEEVISCDCPDCDTWHEGIPPLQLGTTAQRLSGDEDPVCMYQLTANVTGGTPPYQFLWELTDGQTSESNPATFALDNCTSYGATVTVTDSSTPPQECQDRDEVCGGPQDGLPPVVESLTLWCPACVPGACPTPPCPEDSGIPVSITFTIQGTDTSDAWDLLKDPACNPSNIEGAYSLRRTNTYPGDPPYVDCHYCGAFPDKNACGDLEICQGAALQGVRIEAQLGTVSILNPDGAYVSSWGWRVQVCARFCGNSVNGSIQTGIGCPLPVTSWYVPFPGAPQIPESWQCYGTHQSLEFSEGAVSTPCSYRVWPDPPDVQCPAIRGGNYNNHSVYWWMTSAAVTV